MKKRIFASFVLPALILIALGTQAAFAQKQYHGADSVFRAEGIAVYQSWLLSNKFKAIGCKPKTSHHC